MKGLCDRMQITFLGGAHEVGASCVYVELDGKKLVFDCGMRMGKVKDTMPDLRLLQEKGGVDAIFLSHAHMDHCGYLPVLSRAYPLARIYCTHITKELIRTLLSDSLKISGYKEDELPIFNENHIEQMLDRMICFNPNYTFKPFNDCDIKVNFYSAGHIAGAVCISVQGQEGTLLYTGDFSLTRQSTVEGASLPKLRPDVMICESTYGDRLHANREMEEKRLVDAIKQVIEAGGKILIPAFALGRAQDIILIIKRAMAKKQLPHFPVYVDGMVKDICRIYEKYPQYLREQLSKKILKGNPIFFNEQVIKVDTMEQRKEIVTGSDPCCIIASSGMLTGGASVFYAQHLLENPNAFVAITGYQDEEAPGRLLMTLMQSEEQERKIILDEKKIQVRANIKQYGLSAHADQAELVGVISQLNPRYTFLVHGNSEVVEAFGKEVQAETSGNVFVPENGETIDVHLVNPRKQYKVQELPVMHEKEALTEESLEKLWQFLLKEVGTKRGLVVEELYAIWYGRQDFTEADIQFMNKLCIDSPYFKRELKRPFVYHVVPEEELEKVNPDEPMEVNAMLSKVDEYFNRTMGLYKKGARYEEKIVLLSFVFPQKAAQQYQNIIKAFEEETRWKVELNTGIHIGEAEVKIRQMLGEYEVKITSISYYNDKNRFRVKVLDCPSPEEISRRFFEETGVELEIVGEGGGKADCALQKKAVSPKREDALEQNKALWYVDQTFSVTEHSIYKRGIKHESGIPVIEIAFICPQIARLYEKEIQALREVTGWDVIVSETPNQQALQNLMREICSQYHIMPSKISYMPLSKSMQVKCYDEMTAEQKAQIEEAFKQKTCMEVSFK